MTFKKIANVELEVTRAQRELGDLGWELKNVERTEIRSENRIGYSSIDPRVTTACDHACQHCWAQLGGKSMSVEVFRKVLEFAKESGVETIQFTGGEVTLWNNLEEMVKLSKEMGFKNVIRTHGRHLQKVNGGSELTNAEIITRYFDKVVVSLDGLANENFNMRPAISHAKQMEKAKTRLKCIVEKQFKETINGYKFLCKTAKDVPDLEKRPEVHINTVVARKNHDKLQGLATYLNDQVENEEFFIDRWDITQVSPAKVINEQTVSCGQYEISDAEFLNTLVKISLHSQNITKRAKPITAERNVIIDINGGIFLGGEEGKYIGSIVAGQSSILAEKIRQFAERNGVNTSKDKSYMYYSP